ncbi:MAG: sulfur oxidation c-type cytochrome SoxX [Porticoccaceae bacterium]|nr:sulfur oxidation c-type cytochrome SoxX [Porticoccaceae bacterium]
MKIAFTVLLTIAAMISYSVMAEEPLEQTSPIANPLEQGKAIAFDRSVGNCLACHMIDDGELPGNSGPPLLQMKLRFPDREVLRAQVWDATVRNPNTVMPPYGKHKILNDKELDLVVDYLLSL